MPELLLELFSEEIPARMQSKAAEDLKSIITNALVEAGLTYEGAQVHATPRRLVLSVEGLNAKAADTSEERKGPRIDAPQPAIDGFLKSTGLRLDQLTIQEDKKGKSYIAIIKKSGRAATDVIAEIVPHMVRNFPWPKSMRWGSGTLRWIRPLQSILCTFDGEVVPFEVEGIKSGNTTFGHRFLSSGAIEARRFDDYAGSLQKAFVIVDANARMETIRADAKNLAFAQGLEMIEDEALLKEVAGLVEWPVVLMGSFDKNYLNVPEEVIITTIKNNQKCFCLRGPSRLTSLAPQDEGTPHPEVPHLAASKGQATGKLSNHYLLVANTIASDGGKTIIHGNNKVIAARLSDAKFFWDQDRKIPLADLLPKLDAITFHAKLGSQGQQVGRVEALAKSIANSIGADTAKTSQAARLAKADLVTGMVGEFPELQGQMGRYYAIEQGIDSEVADAIRDHYRPLGPTDSLPKSKVGQAIAIADKIDRLVCFWLVDEKPTGSKDPFALRRAANGAVTTILENELRLPLISTLLEQERRVMAQLTSLVLLPASPFIEDLKEESDIKRRIESATRANQMFEKGLEAGPPVGWEASLIANLLYFILDRLSNALKDKGYKRDVVDAVVKITPEADLTMVAKRVAVLSKFLETDDGKNLLAGVKRAANILRIEEKKDDKKYSGDVNPAQLIKGEEKALHSAISQATALARKAVEAEDFEGAMRAIAKLRVPVDEFFEGVIVNDKDATFRENRLRLLNRIREATAEVADFSKIEG